jgi:uncharacterized membrane protein YtjA (UPF0391 family)
MLRWIAVLSVLSILTGLCASGVFWSGAQGLASILFLAYVGLLSLTLVIGVLRG